ncbi:uncharacterized protein LOC119586412 [Penaeus monodon]|uniref:uncharacterized protein LOC119586412 n=1 Tax=Penaeus monodon TaxID=6687 RepID=UPI0018A7E018|nr:uncharacterized protein LOC119586412 [Penaeus monodon]
MAKRKLNRGRLQLTGVREEDGTLTTDRERVVSRAQEFYEKLYSSTRPEPPPPPPTEQKPAPEEPEIQQRFHEFPDIKDWEVKLAVKQSKKGKAPGPDNITIDLIEAAGDVVYDKLATLFNECLRQSTIPDEWNEAFYCTRKEIKPTFQTTGQSACSTISTSCSPKSSQTELREL